MVSKTGFTEAEDSFYLVNKSKDRTVMRHAPLGLALA
jgi:hypothetical protein